MKSLENNAYTNTRSFADTLYDLGLASDEIKIYEYLIRNHDKKASEIAQATGISRVLTYRGLEKLLQKDVIEKTDLDGSPAFFTAKHPSHLTTVLDKQKRRIAKAELELGRDLGFMTSEFNLATGKPNIQFFEGLSGIQKVLDDTLTTSGTILTYTDLEAVITYFDEVNQKYVKQRERLGVQKKVLVLKNDFAIEQFQKMIARNPDYLKVTNARYVDSPLLHIQGALQIYDNKIGLITVSDKNLIGIIIEDERITTMLRSLFEALYAVSESVSASS